MPLHQVDVEVPVVVVVEERRPRAHDLQQPELPGHAVEVDEVETGLGGGVHEEVAAPFRSPDPSREAGHEEQRRQDETGSAPAHRRQLSQWPEEGPGRR